MNSQIGVGDSKYVVVFDPLLTGHVIRRMRSGRVRVFNGNQSAVFQLRALMYVLCAFVILNKDYLLTYLLTYILRLFQDKLGKLTPKM